MNLSELYIIQRLFNQFDHGVQTPNEAFFFIEIQIFWERGYFKTKSIQCSIGSKPCYLLLAQSNILDGLKLSLG